MRCSLQDGCTFFNYRPEDTVCCTSTENVGGGNVTPNPSGDGRTTYIGSRTQVGDLEYRGQDLDNQALTEGIHGQK